MEYCFNFFALNHPPYLAKDELYTEKPVIRSRSHSMLLTSWI